VILRWTLRRKFAVFVIFAAACATAAVVVVYSVMANSRAAAELLLANQLTIRQHMEVDMNHDAMRGDVLNAIHYGGGGNAEAPAAAAQEQTVRKSFAQHRAKIDDGLKQIAAMPLSAELRTQAQKLANLFATYTVSADRLIGQAFHERDAAEKALPVFSGLFSELEDEQAKFSNRLDQLSAQTKAGVDETTRRGMLAIVVVGVLALIPLLLALQIMLASIKSLRRGSQVAKAVASGDLTQEIAVTTNDETGELMQALQDMSTGLNHKVSHIAVEVRAASEAILGAARQLVAGNINLSGRAEQQASTVEETAASVEELSSTVKQNARNAAEAKQLAENASQIAARGGEVVARVVDTMGDIHTSSKKIVDIIAVIDGIAFQTNILALNAAVEAARAGEQGRGFSVVAAEVRNLAQRSAAASKQIKQLIEESVSKVGTGSKLVSEAGASVTETLDSIRRVTALMFDIANASQEQSEGVEQINHAIIQIDSVTQQSAALVEEATAAAESLEKRAHQMLDLLEGFKLAGAARASAVPRTPPEPTQASRRPQPVVTPPPRRADVKERLRAPKSEAPEEDWAEF
jgi:methyl-accepting chemotaxis protein